MSESFLAKNGEPLIKVENLCVDFKIGKELLHAVRDISFTLNQGEIIGVVGESGSGKSVSATALLGLLGSTARVTGNIFINGQEALKFKSNQIQTMRRNFFGAIFQEPSRSFDPIYTIEKTFFETFRATNPSITKTESFDKAVSLLEEVAIANPASRLKNYPHQFSGGMLQRIMIALALANDPKVLIADEPTTALDVTIADQIVQLLKGLQVRRKLSIIFISHNLPLVSQISHRILVMYGGKILESGRTIDVISEPKSPYTFGLLHSLPKLGTHYKTEKLFTIGGPTYNPVSDTTGCPFAPRCDYAKKLCFSSTPSEHKIGEQLVACHFPLSFGNNPILGGP